MCGNIIDRYKYMIDPVMVPIPYPAILAGYSKHEHEKR
jgi:hypothetical protein